MAVFPEGEEGLPRLSGAPLPPKFPEFVGEIDLRYFAKAPKKRGKAE